MSKLKSANSAFTKTMTSPHASAHANAFQIGGGFAGGAAYVNEKHKSNSTYRHKANKGSH